MEILMEKETNVSHACYVKFQFVYADLKKAERRAADFCLSNPELVSGSTINEVASMAGCSEATFVRLAKRLGYHGYPELRDALLLDQVDQITDEMEIDNADTFESIAQNVINANIQALQDSLASINYGNLERTIHAIETAKRIMFAATGDANIVALTGVQKFLRIGLNVDFNTDLDTQLIRLSQMQKGDLLICISHSGRTSSVYDFAKLARSKGIVVIAITGFPQAPIAKIADIVLLTVSYKKDMMGEVISKRTPALCMIDIIYTCLLVHLPSQYRDILDTANEMLAKNKF